ncbi:MAG: helicase-associated domain-containing protein [Treponema sp.]|jgi:hypothetical protein|nr:helicase-associated domain-containing protein [Treponema sp.]
MSGFSFRSPEDWKSALLTLPDSSYFELMRSVFGNIKTPFNKQRLVDDLGSFLSKKDIQEAIAAYIDEKDAKVIAAIAMLEEPAPGELEAFFAGEFSYAELLGILLNLEERLILYRVQGGRPLRESAVQGVRRLALNPLLEPALRPIIGNRNALLPSQPLSASVAPGNAVAGSVADQGIRDDRILAALFAFVAAEPEFFRVEGGIRKKVLEDGKVLFNGLDLESLAGGLQALGLLRQSAEGSAGGLVCDESKMRRFKALSYSEAREYLAAGICVNRRAPAPFLHNRSRIHSLARFINAFMGTLKTDRQYPRSTLVRLMDMLERGGVGGLRGSFALDQGGDRLKGSGLFDSILDALEIADLLCVGPGGDCFRCAPREDSAVEGAAVIAMDTAFSCLLYPEISFADALSLASFSLVRETGAAVRFEFTRESVVRGFDLGLDGDCMIALLDRLSGNQVEQNLRWTVKDWEARYSGVSLFQGLTLVLAEDRRYLAEAEPVASLISRTLAPGVYLLAAEDRASAIQSLHRAGIDIVAQPSQPPVVGSRHGDKSSPYPPLAEAFRFLRNAPAPDNAGEKAQAESLSPDPIRAGRYKERFRAALEKLSLAKGEREELAARIERRLILSESQLAAVPARYEKLEARGLDYVGKTSIAKQAIASKQLIEIVWSGQKGEENRAVGLPNALQKSGGETLLVLKPVPSGDPISLPLGKIGLLRRVKQSLFGD